MFSRIVKRTPFNIIKELWPVSIHRFIFSDSRRKDCYRPEAECCVSRIMANFENTKHAPRLLQMGYR